MQKAYSIVILGLLISMLTACGNDEPNNESTSIMIMYNRAVNTDNNDVTFSQSNCQFVLRNSGSLSMQAHMILKLDNSNTVEFSTDFMPLTASGHESYTHTFSAASVTAGSHTISNLRGKINLVGPTFIQYVVDGKYQCFSTLQPYYTHTTTSNNRTESTGAVSYTTTDCKYGLVFNNADNQGTLYLFDFHLSDGGTSFNILCYDKLNLEITTTGYRLTGSDIVPTSHESNYDTHGTLVEQYRASTITIDVTQQGQALSGTIKTGTDESPIDITLNGTFFETNL